DTVVINVSVGAANAAASTMETSRTAMRTDDSATITVRLKDSHGNSLTAGGDDVELFADYGSLSSVTDEGNGTYTATFTAETPGTATITGTVNGVSMTDTVVINVSVGAANATTSTMETSQTSMTTDDSATITVRLKDSHGNFLTTGDDNVELSTDHGSLSSVTDEGNGTYTATFTAETPGTATITGTVNGDDMSAFVEVVVSVGAASPTTSTMEADKASITTDDTASISVRLKDAYDNPLTTGGDVVLLHTGYGTLTEVKDNGDGTYSATFSATAPGRATITGSVNGVAMTDTVVI